MQLPPHPDGMSPIEQFKILIEEQPAIAADVLERGTRAIQTLVMIRHFMIGRTLQSGLESSYYEPRQLDRKDTLPVVSMKFGVLWDRYQRLGVDWNRLIDMVNHAIDGALCPDCGEPLTAHFTTSED